jgi:triacylglycerol esterase/lipase EstA (alpha/beta hydrolase family)
MLDSLSPQRRRLVFGAGAIALVLIMALAVITVIRIADGSTHPVSQTDQGPVLLVPGYGGNVQSLQPLAAALRLSGRTAVIVDPVGDGTGDLRAQAEHLGEVADRVRDESGAASVDAIGYSAGGVVARLWIRDDGGANMARRVLTLGSPNHGTNQAALGAEFAGGCPTACEQLIPNSDLLRRLNAGDETPAGPLWATVRSTSDQVVTPTDSAALSGALNIVVQNVCPGSTAAHGDLPGNPVVLAALDSILGVPTPHAPSNVDC